MTGMGGGRPLQVVFTRQEQFCIKKEQSGNYAPTHLRVDVAGGSNSETEWERED